jgi:hypothetical protein
MSFLRDGTVVRGLFGCDGLGADAAFESPRTGTGRSRRR